MARPRLTWQCPVGFGIVWGNALKGFLTGVHAALTSGKEGSQKTERNNAGPSASNFSLDC